VTLGRAAGSRLLCGCLIGVLGATMAPARADQPAPAGQERVLLWPRDPRTDVQPGERALAAAGRTVAPFAGLGARLRERGELAEARASEVLDAVQAGLAQARQAYLEQRFDDMIAALEKIEARSLAVLAEPEHVAVLWEVSFQRGLAHRARAARGGAGATNDTANDTANSTASDAAQAALRFRLALALDPERRPLRELYGPEVSAAFAEAVSADAAAPQRPVRLEVTPADAIVAIDGVPVVATGSAPGRTRHLRPGLHVARASAPGYETGAVLVTVDGSRVLRVVLQERRDPDPLARIDASWSAGALAPGTASGQHAIVDAAASVGAGLVIVVDAASVPGRVTAQALSGARVDAPVQADTLAGAVDAALARWEGRAPAPAGIAATAARPPWWQRWWVWAGVGGALATGAAAAILLTRDDADRWQIYVPPP
jgi:hypothetical protein